MERARLLEAVEAITKLHALGATRVRVGDIEASFGPVAADAPVEETPEERQKRIAAERESVLFHSAAD